MEAPEDFLRHLRGVQDPRNIWYVTHPLINVLAIGLIAVICSADDWDEVVEFGEANEAWLGTFLNMQNGVPSADTFGRVFQRMSPESFEACLRSWTQAALQGNNGDVIAIDGKALRRSHDQYWGQDAILVVNAWATQAGVTLGQLRTSAESNEVPTLTQLLKQLRLKDCIVTADAMHCQTENALEVVEQGGDYVFAAKGNQGLLQQHIIEIFDNPMDGVKFDTARTLEKQHGRIEERVCTVLTHSGLLEYADPHERWFGLKSIIRMERKQTRVLDGEIKQNTSYYISSLDVSANRLMSIIRSHWLIENALHWVLDVEFNEDRARSRKGHAADNFAVLRRLALNLLKLTPIPMRTRQPSIKIRRKRALWDKPYLLRVLGALT